MTAINNLNSANKRAGSDAFVGPRIYNVMQYDGVDNTGATASSTAFQSAITAASDAGGGKVIIPAGTYEARS